MAFCDNPKCRFKDCEGAGVKYIKQGKPRLITANTPIDLHAPICDGCDDFSLFEPTKKPI